MNNKEKFIFSCVIMSAENIDDLNESFNIKNPYGVETFELVFNIIYSSLLFCTITPIVFIILEIKTENKENCTKLVLDRPQIENMSHEDIKAFLKNKCNDFFFS